MEFTLAEEKREREKKDILCHHYSHSYLNPRYHGHALTFYSLSLLDGVILQREDDGVVLSALLRAEGRDREVCMLVLDASTFTELGRVEFRAPGPVPKCLHGWFVPEGSLSVHNQGQRQMEREDKSKEE